MNKYVKFDCIVGNPPYQTKEGNPPRAFYPKFVNKAIEMEPQYLSMIIPAKWTKGSGNDIAGFLKTMLECKGLSKIVMAEKSKDWFPDVGLLGGIMYFFYDRDKKTNIVNINGVGVDLTEKKFIPTDAVSMQIMEKVMSKGMKTFDKVMFGNDPYGIKSNYNKWLDTDTNAYVCHCRGGKGNGSETRLIAKDVVKKNLHSIDKWKLCTAHAYGTVGYGGGGTGNCFLVEPNKVVSGSYLVLAYFDTENEGKNACDYFRSPFAQFMISILKNTQQLPKRVFSHLPYLDFTKKYYEKDIYDLFEIDREEIEYIIKMTKNFKILK